MVSCALLAAPMLVAKAQGEPPCVVNLRPDQTAEGLGLQQCVGVQCVEAGLAVVDAEQDQPLRGMAVEAAGLKALQQQRQA